MRSIVCAIAVMTLAGPATLEADETASFVVMLGADTLSLEQFTRTATQVRGEYLQAGAPRGPRDRDAHGAGGGAEAMLRMSWDRTRASVPIRSQEKR